MILESQRKFPHKKSCLFFLGQAYLNANMTRFIPNKQKERKKNKEQEFK